MTLYLVLTLASLLPLYFVLAAGAKAGAARMQMESVCRISQNAALSEFQRELHGRYDLFMVDTSYGGPGHGSEMLAQHVKGYLDSNCERKLTLPFGGVVDFTSLKIGDISIPETRFACDHRGQAVREQVYAYMAADPAGELIASVLVTADEWKGLEISGREWVEETQQSQEDLMEALREKRQEQRQENEEKEENDEEVTDEEREAASGRPSEAENMVSELESFQFLPILFQVFGNPDRLSRERIPYDDDLCRRPLHTGDGLKPSNSHQYPEADEILFDRYIYEKTGNCVRPSEDGQLRYQTEYILCGKASDRENLEGIAERLLLIREASNCVYLSTDGERMAQIHAVAAAAALILLNPELEGPVSKALTLAWSYLESVQDVRTLMTGGRVPLKKTGQSWQTHLYELLTPLEAIKDRDSGEGLDYSTYLQGLLMLEGSSVKTQRTMNVMEMDVRKITGNRSFRMDYCLDAFRLKAGGSSCGIQFDFDGACGYN